MTTRLLQLERDSKRKWPLPKHLPGTLSMLNDVLQHMIGYSWQSRYEYIIRLLCRRGSRVRTRVCNKFEFRMLWGEKQRSKESNTYNSPTILGDLQLDRLSFLVIHQHFDPFPQFRCFQSVCWFLKISNFILERTWKFLRMFLSIVMKVIGHCCIETQWEIIAKAAVKYLG